LLAFKEGHSDWIVIFAAMAGEVMFIKWISWKHCEIGKGLEIKMAHIAIIYDIFC
jgi:hypothetical protein